MNSRTSINIKGGYFEYLDIHKNITTLNFFSNYSKTFSPFFTSNLSVMMNISNAGFSKSFQKVPRKNRPALLRLLLFPDAC
jgi:hypothetical protein